MFKVPEGETRMLQAIRKILPDIAAAADETERNRGLSAELIDRLGEAGIFRMMLPKVYGGEELDFVQSMRIGEELAYADMSAGWTVMVTCGLNLSLGQFPPSTVQEILSGGPDARMRGVTAPRGRFTAVEGGYRLSGRWAFASGSFAPDWMLAAGFVHDGDDIRMKDGAPLWCIAIVRGCDVTILDTWYTAGLRGTASHDFVIEDLFVPESHVVPIFAPALIDTPAYRVLSSVANTAHHAGVRIGCARAMLDELAAMAVKKRSSFDANLVLSEAPGFKASFGKLLVRLDVARSYADAVMRDLWQIAALREKVPESELARARCMLAYVSEECADIATEAFRLAGSSAIYDGCSIQRRLRDLQVAAQHPATDRNSYGKLGSVYIDQLVPAETNVTLRAA